MKVYGQAMAGGPLHGAGVPVPTQPITREGSDVASRVEAQARFRQVQVVTTEPNDRIVRAWAHKAGIECPNRGRVPGRVWAAYRKVHQIADDTNKLGTGWTS